MNNHKVNIRVHLKQLLIQSEIMTDNLLVELSIGCSLNFIYSLSCNEYIKIERIKIRQYKDNQDLQILLNITWVDYNKEIYK